MRPESGNSTLIANSSLTHVSVTSQNMTISRQRFGKHVPAATNSRGIIHCWAMVPAATVKPRKTE
jgi:hypothetical protein